MYLTACKFHPMNSKKLAPVPRFQGTPVRLEHFRAHYMTYKMTQQDSTVYLTAERF